MRAGLAALLAAGTLLGCSGVRVQKQVNILAVFAPVYYLTHDRPPRFKHEWRYSMEGYKLIAKTTNDSTALNPYFSNSIGERGCNRRIEIIPENKKNLKVIAEDPNCIGQFVALDKLELKKALYHDTLPKHLSKNQIILDKKRLEKAFWRTILFGEKAK